MALRVLTWQVDVVFTDLFRRRRDGLAADDIELVYSEAADRLPLASIAARVEHPAEHPEGHPIERSIERSEEEERRSRLVDTSLPRGAVPTRDVWAGLEGAVARWAIGVYAMAT